MICGMRSDLLTLRLCLFPSVSQREVSVCQKNVFQSDGCGCCLYVVKRANKAMEFHASSMSGAPDFNMASLAFTDGVVTL